MLTKDHSFNQYIEEIFIEMPDCISDPIDYKTIIEDIFQLTKGILHLDAFEGQNSSERKIILKLTINNKPYTFKISDSEYFELSLLNAFNDIIREVAPSENKKFINLFGGAYDFAIGFMESEVEYKLFKADLIWRDENWKQNYLIIKKYITTPTLKEDSSMLPEYWLGYFMYDGNTNAHGLFKLKVTKKSKTGEIEGHIFEDENLDDETKILITFKGKRDNETIRYSKRYKDDGSIQKIAELFNATKDEIIKEKNENFIEYEGKFLTSWKATGTWSREGCKIIIKGRDFSSKAATGTWEMKRIS